MTAKVQTALCPMYTTKHSVNSFAVDKVYVSIQCSNYQYFTRRQSYTVKVIVIVLIVIYLVFSYLEKYRSSYPLYAAICKLGFFMTEQATDYILLTVDCACHITVNPVMQKICCMAKCLICFQILSCCITQDQGHTCYCHKRQLLMFRQGKNKDPLLPCFVSN